MLPSGENDPALISHLSLVSHSIFCVAISSRPTLSYPLWAFEVIRMVLPSGERSLANVGLLALMRRELGALAGGEIEHEDVGVFDTGVGLGVDDELAVARKNRAKNCCGLSACSA